MADPLVKSILDLRHAAFVAYEERWKRAEKRLRGGEAVTADLFAFEWEEEQGDHHKKRIDRAVYLPLGAETARKFVDSISREAPRPGDALPDRALSFGALGAVRPSLGGSAVEGSAPASDGTGQGDMTEAELVWTNVDGTGDDGSAWDVWWDGVQRRTMATGFRWVGVEEPAGRPATAADVRPYAVEFSPTETPYWLVQAGTLQVLHVLQVVRRLVLEGDKVVEKEETQHLLYVRAGFEGFGDRFLVGGWWLFKDDGDPVLRADNTSAEGRWTTTDGAIPYVRFFYERDPLDVSGARAGLDEVNAIALGIMDLEAAARHDGLVGGGRTVWIGNTTKGGHKDTIKQLASGSRAIGVEANPTNQTPPSISNVEAAGVSGAITDDIDRLMSWARMIATKELTTSPDASGIAKTVEYEAEVSPRLAYMASMREEAQAFVLRMFELRWGKTAPASSVRYPRRYTLESVSARLLTAANTLSLAGVSSTTLSARLASAIVAEAGLGLSDAERTTIAEEITASAARAAQARSAADDLLA